MRKKSITAALTLVIVMIFVAAGYVPGPVSSFALEPEPVKGEVLYGCFLKQPAEKEIYVRHESGGAGNSTRHVIKLSASDPSSPMPDNSEEGILEVGVSGSTETGLGVMSFEHPGVYYYDVSHGDDKGNTDNTYRVMIAVYNDGSSDMVIWDMSDGSKADEIIFRDPHRTTPKTGDDNSEIMLLAGIGSLSLAAMALLLRKRRSLEDE